MTALRVFELLYRFSLLVCLALITCLNGAGYLVQVLEKLLGANALNGYGDFMIADNESWIDYMA